jgi:hypothetical protein
MVLIGMPGIETSSVALCSVCVVLLATLQTTDLAWRMSAIILDYVFSATHDNTGCRR